MNSKSWRLASFTITGLLLVQLASADSAPTAPVAKKEPVILDIHGYHITDSYAWLRDRGDTKSPAIIDYLEQENAYTEHYTAAYKGLTDTLYQEMLGRLKQSDQSVPERRGNYWYFTRTEQGMQYPIYLRSTTKDGKDATVLLNPNELAKSYPYFAIANFAPSDDGQLLAYATDTTGYRQYRLQIKDLSSGQMLATQIEGVTSVQWSNDGKYLFYAKEDPVSKRSDQIFRHTLGTSDKDELVFSEPDLLFNLEVGRSRDQKMFFITSTAKTSSEAWYLAANDPTGTFRMISRRREGHEYSANFDNGEFYIRTNKDAANFKVVRAPANLPGEENWTDFISYDPLVKIEAIDFFKDYAVVSELENGLEFIRVIDRRPPGDTTRIATPESVYTIALTANPDYDIDAIRYEYSSMITPNSTYQYALATGNSELLKQQEIPSGYDKSRYVTSRVWATARDGVKVPVSIMMRKGTRLDGKAPLLLYGYGSYGLSMPANFSSARLSLVDRGMIYAIAHIRGGGELGEPWRRDGRMYKKMNTFHDFIDSAQWLIGQHYTSADRLVIEGRSAGGLLMGAVVNQSPGTFKAAIAQVPFVDVMNTMLDASLPLTTEEWIEWGNPHEKPAWDYMITYSPYENIKAQNYPNMLIEVALYDSQVPYWEGAKFAARLRATKTDNNIILLKSNLTAGHGGASGRYDRLQEMAFDYAYALTQVGITK